MIRSVDEILSEKFELEVIKDVLQSPTREREKFFLAIQFIYNFENKQQQKNGLHLLNNRINRIDTSEFVHEDLIASILETSSAFRQFSSGGRNPSHIRQILQFIINKASDKKTFTMAIQRRLLPQVDEQENSHATTTTASMDDIANFVEVFNLTLQNEAQTLDEAHVGMICHKIVRMLSEVTMRHDANSISFDKLHSQTIIEFFTNINKYNSTKILILQLVYETLITPIQKNISGAVALALHVVPEVHIGEAVLHLLNSVSRQCNQDNEIYNAIHRLCQYHRFINAPLEIWIIKVIEVLRSEKQEEILCRIIDNNIKNLIISILMPLTRVKSFQILKAMLMTKIYSGSILSQVMNRSEKTLDYLKKDHSMEINQEIFEDMLTIIVDYMNCCPSEYRSCTEYTNFMKSLYEMSRGHNLYFNSSSKLARLSSATNNVNRGVGLENLGNTCYLNSVIQALFMTKPFSTELLRKERNCRDIMAIQQIFALLTFSERSYVNIKFAMQNIRPMDFIPGLQQDSSEFMGSFLDRLHEADKKCIKNEDGDEMDTQQDMTCVALQNGIASAASKLVVDNTSHLKHPTIIYKHFGGKLSTTCVCSSCNTKSIIIDSFRDLALSFPEKEKNVDDWDEPEPKYSVQQLLDFYFETEQLTLDNQYRCDNCKSLCDGTRCTELLQPPKHLILTLKHFHYDPKFHTRSKLLIKNMFHNPDITVKVKMGPDVGTREVSYKLYSAVVHSGMSLDSGHYYTYAQNRDRWFKFNDSYVSKSDAEELHKLDSLNTPYILFYQIVSTASSTNMPNTATTNNVDPTAEIVDFVDIPSYLKSFVLEDNDTFRREGSKSFRIKFQSPVKPWNNDDDPPPSSCGNNIDMHTNRFIY